MKLFKLIFFLLIANVVQSQSYWSFKQREQVPIYTAAINFNDSVSTTQTITPTISKVTSYAMQLSAPAPAVSSGCIDNLDFEFGDFTNWKCYKGSAKTNGTTNYTTWSPSTPVAPISNRHQIVSASSLPINDPYGGFPRLCPNGGNYSLQLGNDQTGAQAEKVSCSFTIPADQTNFQIEYYYAVVFQDPNHPFDEQPRFQAKVYDANNSSNVISCASYDFTAASGLPGFKVSTLDNSVLYKPWSAVTINLSGYAGHTVILEFTTEDCTLGGHFGYAYVDVSSNCVSLTKTITYCKNTPSISLDAPSGYEKYNWYNSSYTQLLGTGQTVTLSPPPSANEVVNVDLIPYSGFGCRDTAYAVLNVNPVPAVNFASNAVACVGKPISFTNTSSISDNTTMTYRWDFGDNTTSTSTNYTKTYNSVGNYNVKLVATSINGCTDSIVKSVSVGALAAINPIVGNKNICLYQTELLQNTTAGGVWKSANPTVATINNAGLVTAISGGVDTIRYIVSNSYGCIDSVSFALKVIPTSFSTTNAAICQGYTYTFNGVTYNTAGTYLAHLTNIAGCDSTATLNLTVKLPTSSTTTVSICTSDFPYSWNSGSYPAAGTYTRHFTNAVGCDSVATLVLKEKLLSSSTTTVSICTADFPYSWNSNSYPAAGTYTRHFTNAVGCDSVAILVLKEKLPSSSTTTVSICTADFPYSWNSNSYPTAGTYTMHFTNAVGCDSVATLVLKEKLPTSSSTNVSICTADFPYSWNSSTYPTAGTYTKTFTNAVGCDSVATLVLKEKLPSSSITNVSICTADFPYSWNSSNYPAAGTYTQHFTNAVGCDSVATLVLKEKLPTSSITNVSICTADFPYSWNSSNYPTAGTYTKTFTNAVGCDSVATLVLKEKLPTSSTTTVSICTADFPYSWNSSSYPTAGTYTKTFTNAVGCDSVATLVLKEKLPSSSTTTVSICTADFPYSWNSSSYPTAGTYTQHFTNAVGCDSVAILVLKEKLPTTSTTNVSICTADFPYSWNSSTYPTAGTYTKTFTNAVGCDSVATLVLKEKLPSSSITNVSICTADFPYSWNSSSYPTAGTYTKHFTNAVGCDSVATLVLKEKLPTSSTTNVSICTADFPYSWNSSSYPTAGTYNKTFTNVAGCDSVATLVLKEKLPSSSTTNVSICTADFPYSWNSSSYPAAGIYTKTFTNAVGCDSVATLVLKEKLPSSSITNVSICTSDFPYSWNTSSYPTAGTYTKHFTNAVGCDSVATLVLKEKLPSSSTTNVSICTADFPYSWNSSSYPTAGTYTKHFTNVAGCDSVATLVLKEKLPSSSTTNVSICTADFPYSWNSSSYPAAGTYTKHFTNAVGCDSVATLVLKEKLPSSSTTNVSICTSDFPYSWNSNSYPTAGTYTQHFTNAVGCDSVATLVLKEKLPSSSTTTVSICTSDFPYSWNTSSYPAAGTYTKTFTNAVGCDSVATLVLKEKLLTTSTTNVSICTADFPYSWNSSNYPTAGTYTKHFTNAVGCDSVATLVLKEKLLTSSITNVAICQGDSYIFDGTTYSAAGTYIKHLINVAGCDSVATLNLSVKLPTVSTTNAAICLGDTYTFNGTVYNSTGIYIKHLTNFAGCDSTATLNLVVKLPTMSTTNASICQGDTYTFNGTVYSAGGIYSKHFINTVGCDSTATLNLTIKLPTSSITNASICQGDLYTFNGTTYAIAGTYVKHLINAVGCDSTATLNLTIKLPTSSITNAAICQGDSYTFDGTSYSTAGTYIKHLTNVAGCDSVATLNLTIKLPTASNTIKTICSKELPFSWNGLIFNAAGSQTAVLINSVGCDSVATLKLNVNSPTTSFAKKTICSQDLPFVWNGLTFNAAGTKSVTLTSAVGCDSVATLELNVNATTGSTTEYTTCPSALPFVWNGMSYNSAGKYTFRLTNATGCDSIATLILNVKTPLTSTTTDYICSSLLPYVWNKKLYYKSGTYTTQLINSAGCDSIATLMLTVVSPSASVSREAVSSTQLPYVWNKMAFTETGTYTSPEKYINSMGCDSIAKLILKVNLSTSADTYASVCASDLPYTWNGTLYDAAGTYTKIMTNALGEDVTVTLYLKVIAAQTTSQTIHIFSGESYTINGHDYDKAGVYTDYLKTVNGCDSTVVTDLSFINIPNTITPNKDGYNDVFMKGWHIKIYNRNGILMYDGMEGWDGTYNNKPVSKDTYFYVLFYTSGLATKSKEGYLMVIP